MRSGWGDEGETKRTAGKIAGGKIKQEKESDLGASNVGEAEGGLRERTRERE